MTEPKKPISFTAHLEVDLWEERADARRLAREREVEQRERVQKALRADEDARKRAWIEAGHETRQPPEYRGRVFDHADRDGVHPTAFPPLRNSPQDSLSDEFIAFQAYNQTTFASHPRYYCVRCQARYNARDGGLCGPCIAATDEVGQMRKRFSREVQTEYPL